MLKCKICDYECSKNYLSTHVKKKHSLSYREYYDSYVKEENEGKCLECGKETRYNNGIGENGWKYSLYCSNRCRQLHTHGVENQFQLESVKAKAKKTIRKKYGVENASQAEMVKKKKEETLFKNYGVVNPSYSKEIRNKANKTNLSRYGSSNAMHSREIAEKASLNGGGRARTYWYKTKCGNKIKIQGSYEKKFVAFCEGMGYTIEDGPRIEYLFKNKRKNYYSDFLITRQDGKKIIVEIKSTYWYNIHKEQTDAKNQYAEKYANKNGMKFCFIINDNKKKVLDLTKLNILKEIK
jgi:hypothetical protein